MDSPRRSFDADQEAARAQAAARTLSETTTRALLESLEAPSSGGMDCLDDKIEQVGFLEAEIDDLGQLSPPTSARAERVLAPYSAAPAAAPRIVDAQPHVAPPAAAPMAPPAAASPCAAKIATDIADPMDLRFFRFKKPGGAKVVHNGRLYGEAAVATRQTYRCTHPECKFQIVEDYYETEVVRTPMGEHSPHPLPARPRTNPAVLDQVRDILAKSSMSSARLHDKCVFDAIKCYGPDAEISSRDVPSKKQIENIKYKLRRDELPGPNAVQNILSEHAASVRKFALHPGVHIVIMAPGQAELLSAHRGDCVIDTTFDCVEGKLYLTTLLALVEGVGVPVAFYIHSGKSELDYTEFLQCVHEATQQRAAPASVLRDFDNAIRNAIKTVWPRSDNLGDLWHLLHDVAKWLNSHSLSSEVSAVIPALKALACVRSVDEFHAALKDFKIRFDYMPLFLAYFQGQWEGRSPVHEWALFTRRVNSPSGSQQIEAWHHHVQHTVLGDEKYMKIDHFVNRLLREWAIINATLRSPQLLQAHMHRQAVARQRATLGAFRAASPVLPASAPVPAPAPLAPPAALALPAPPVPSPAAVSAPAPLAIADEDIDLPCPTNARGQKRKIIPTPVAIAAMSGKRTLCSCTKGTVNSACTAQVCQACCMRQPEPCAVNSHNRAKLAASPHRAIIDAAIQAQRQQPIYIRYDGGSNPGSVRPVVPRRWINAPTSFEAVCVTSGITKKYFLGRVTDARDASFV